jgi:hypothetical protein
MLAPRNPTFLVSVLKLRQEHFNRNRSVQYRKKIAKGFKGKLKV